MKPQGRTLRFCIIDLMSGPEAAVVIGELMQAGANYCNGYVCHLKTSYHC